MNVDKNHIIGYKDSPHTNPRKSQLNSCLLLRWLIESMSCMLTLSRKVFSSHTFDPVFRAHCLGRLNFPKSSSAHFSFLNNSFFNVSLPYCTLLWATRRNEVASFTLNLKIYSAKYSSDSLPSSTFHPKEEHNSLKIFAMLWQGLPFLQCSMTCSFSLSDGSESTFNLRISHKIVFIIIYAFPKMIEAFSPTLLLLSEPLPESL